MPNLVTLCTGNAARSVMAGAILAEHVPALVVSTRGTHVVEGMPMSWRTRDAIVGRRARRPTATAAASSRAPTSPTPTSCSRWRVSTWSTCAAVTPRPRRAPARSSGSRATSPAASGTLAERVASLHLADVVLEPWEDVDDPAGGEPEVFHRCAVEIHELLTTLRPVLGEVPA